MSMLMVSLPLGSSIFFRLGFKAPRLSLLLAPLWFQEFGSTQKIKINADANAMYRGIVALSDLGIDGI